MKPLLHGALGAIVAAVITILALNLSPGEKKIKHSIQPAFGIGDAQFQRSMGHLLGPPLIGGNMVQTLLNGDEIFPSMISAIKGAKRSITFETYIYWSGSIGAEFAKALAERSRAGVKVHVLLDWLGSGKIDDELVETMTRAGVQVERYHPLRWYSIRRMNNRTHRKLLVVDGRIGFTGGVGIADKWTGHAQDTDHWRDTHFRIEGPVVLQMQSAFMDNWLKVRSEVLHGEEYFPEPSTNGEQVAQMFRSSPREGSESIRLMYLLAIASARHSILLENAYFVPDDLAVKALVDASKRGVAVEVIVPGPNVDTAVTRRASRSLWGPLLEAGVAISEYQPTMFHCKVLVVDGLFTSVGSTNFDNRSFRLNDEANLNILDATFAAKQVQIFRDDLKKSTRLTFEQWKRRPMSEKATEWLAGLLRLQL
ncbi:MAG TPA: cardiolipin synthase [Thermoanaerobaculia bacterium]|nr:cardiolipin synthase [Thermoanaerobaculia bacterium]